MRRRDAGSLGDDWLLLGAWFSRLGEFPPGILETSFSQISCVTGEAAEATALLTGSSSSSERAESRRFYRFLVSVKPLSLPSHPSHTPSPRGSRQNRKTRPRHALPEYWQRRTNLVPTCLAPPSAQPFSAICRL